MSALQPHNVAIAEVKLDGRVALIKAAAATENDDAIQLIVDLMAQRGVCGDHVMRLYSERQPSPKWYAYFVENWPNVAVTWSFAPGEDAKMEAAIGKRSVKRVEPWWKFW